MIPLRRLSLIRSRVSKIGLPSFTSSTLKEQRTAWRSVSVLADCGRWIHQSTQAQPVSHPSPKIFPKNSLCHYRLVGILPTQRHNTLFANNERSFSSTAESSGDELTTNSHNYRLSSRCGVRNVAIIAHVDHGKTTMVDQLLLSASNSGNDSTSWKEGDDLNRLLDQNELERERGITITSKVTRLEYYQQPENPTIVNVVDTPGHRDFAGEVDRILSLVDGACLLVDAVEGPMVQTKYVLSRALSLGLKPVVILNKADRPEAMERIESGETESQILDLFDALGATEEQMEYHTIYASARDGWVTMDPDQIPDIVQGKQKEGTCMKTLLDFIIEEIPEPAVRVYDSELQVGETGNDQNTFIGDRFSMAAVTVGYDPYLGRTCTGRIVSGSIALQDRVRILKRDSAANVEDEEVLESSIAGIFVTKGISRVTFDAPFAGAGDIVTLAGVPEDIAVGDTLTSYENPVPVPIETPPLAPQTLSMDFGANNGPLSGQEGTILTSSKIHARLLQETDNNVTLAVAKSPADSEKTVVFARGELQLGILVVQMRREGFELIISPPKILTRTCPETGVKLEPFEEVTVDVDSEFSGAVVNSLTGDRKGTLLEMQETSDGKCRIIFEVPSRGLLGFGSEIASVTRGSAVVNHCYLEDREYAGILGTGLDKGKLVCSESGKATLYALTSIAKRGTLFVAPGEKVYPGMVIGENSKPGDLEVNAVRAKATSNMRTHAKDEKSYLAPPTRYTVEELIGYMGADEVIEVTPESVRLRKTELDAGARQRAARTKSKQHQAMKK